MKRIKIIDPIPKIWMFVFANLIVGLFFTLFFSNSYGQFGVRGLLIGMMWGGLISSTQWLGHAWIGIQIDKKINILDQPVLRIIVSSISIAVYSAIAFAVVQYFAMYLRFSVD